jgi:hypothetical protein
MVNDTDYRVILGIQAPKTSSAGIPLKKPACQYCKKRKIRCDHKFPCNQCRKRKVTCEYDAQPNTQEDIVSKLISQVDQLKSELQVQKQISEYWHNLYQEKSRVDNPIVLKITRRPAFSESTIRFSHNVINAVEKSNNAFLDLTNVFLPNSTSENSLQYSALIWNRLVDSLPEDLVVNIRSMNIDIITQMLYQSSIFSLGTLLLNEKELTKHFHKISALILASHEIHYARNQKDTARLVMLSYIYNLYYLVMNRQHELIAPLWQKAAEFFSFTEHYFSPSMQEGVISTLALIDPAEASKTEFWIRKLEAPVASNNPHKHTTQLLKNVALILVLITKSPQFISMQSQYLQNVFQNTDALLQQVRYSPYYYFYEIMVQSTREITNSFTNFSGIEDTTAWTRKTADLTKLLNKSQQAYILRGYEYLHYIIENKVQPADDCSADLILDQLENFISAFSSDEEYDSSSSAYSNESSDMFEDFYALTSPNNVLYV